MTNEDYIQLAIEVAKQSEKKGGAPIGAIIVKDGEIIAEGKSLVWEQRDPSGHGESNCIRTACKTLDTLDLDGCVMYGTLEPCGMCLSCAAWASLNRIYFGAYRKDVEENHYEIHKWDAEKFASSINIFNGSVMEVKGGILRDECRHLLDGYKNWVKQ